MSDYLACTNCGEYSGSIVAAHIEGLEAKLRKSALQELSALGQASDAYQAQLAAEAKLAKAVEVLEDLANCVDDGCYCSEMHMAAVMDKARTTLAELSSVSCANLKGQDDE